MKIKILMILIVVIIFSQTSVNAQDSNQLLLTITNYQTRDDLDVLFAQATRVLHYTTLTAPEKSVLISLVTIDQKENLDKDGYKPQIIAENPNLLDYVILYHPLVDQSARLAEFGTIYVLSKHETLLKFSKDRIFDHHEGVLTEFFPAALSGNLPTPMYRTKTITPPPDNVAITQAATDSKFKISTDNSSKNTLLPIVVAFFLSVVVTLFILAIIKRILRKKNQVPDELSDVTPT